MSKPAAFGLFQLVWHFLFTWDLTTRLLIGWSERSRFQVFVGMWLEMV